MPPHPYLLTPQAIRDRCSQLFEMALQDQLPHFRVDLEQLQPTATYVLDVMQSAYPDLQVPFHSRWRHFTVGGAEQGAQRLERLQQGLQELNPLEQARVKVDLAITSVLLDAGAGETWQYQEPTTGQFWQRSEGLAVASFDWFLQGGMSSQADQPLQADAIGLQRITAEQLAAAFQVSETNPLVGVAGRVGLLQQLGQTIEQQPQLFGAPARLGNLVDYLVQQAPDQTIAAPVVLQAVLTGLGQIWPGRVVIDGVNLGDVWFHSALPDRDKTSQLVPFHKLSQWLTYSLLEPLQDLGWQITKLDQLTGLAEYRNGGLCVDLGLLQPKQAAVTNMAHLPSSEVIVEWRALTVIALDRIAAVIREQLGLSATALPLVKVLEGGTWAAGRKIAAQRRSGGTPPIRIISDGTVF